MFYFRFRQPVIFYVRRQHGGDIAIIITFQKRMAFLVDVFIFLYNRSVYKYAALLFISKDAFGYKAFD